MVAIVLPKKTKTAQSIVGTNLDGKRPEDDFYPTPRDATKLMLNVEKFNGSVWEPACGSGYMSRAIESKGYQVISTDKTPKGFGEPFDFLYADKLLADNIITNPPFDLYSEFILRAYALKPEKFVFFGKLSVLEGVARSEILERTHLTRVWVSRSRITLNRNGDQSIKGGGMIAFAWFVWERGYTGKPTIGWI